MKIKRTKTINPDENCSILDVLGLFYKKLIKDHPQRKELIYAFD